MIEPREAELPLESELQEYPRFSEHLPDLELGEGDYSCRFARSPAELDEILRLRYQVFNLELGEGLDESHGSGRDVDVYDPQCHHLLVRLTQTNEVVGTYRLQVHEMAQASRGFYSAQLFDLSGLPDEIVAGSVELGRACIAADHRNRQVLFLLWRGLAVYMLSNRKRWFFGCCSLTSQDPNEGARVLELLRQQEQLEPGFVVKPQVGWECLGGGVSNDGWEKAKIPLLFRTYLRHGARICSEPAMDRDFKTIDFLALLDLHEADPGPFLKGMQGDGGALS